MAYIPIIKETKWIDLSDEHKLLRETLEADTKAACCDNGHQQPIMLQGAFGIGKTTTLFYLFHYAWEVLKVPTFYMTLSSIVDRVKEKASKSNSGKVENDEISKIISEMIDEQMSLLHENNSEIQTDLYFPEFESGCSLTEYLQNFSPVELNIEGDTSTYSGLSQCFTQDVIKAGIDSGNKPLLLVDEFESKFYELKKYVEASGGGILRDLFDQIVQNCPFYLVIGNGPASGYEIAKEQSDVVGNDSETAASRRLKPLAVPFPTVNLLSKKFLQDKPNGFINFIWWMSRCRPGHIQLLNDSLRYDTLKDYPSSQFLTHPTFKKPIDESGEEVTYLKVGYFENLDSHLLPLFTDLLLNFEPRLVNLTKSYKDALRASTRNFLCTSDDELICVESELLPALSEDVKKILSDEQKQGKFIGVNYIEHINKYFHYILSALTNDNDKIAFGMIGDKQKDETFAATFLTPLFELSYDFISQYEDDSDDKIKNTKDFLLECIKCIEAGIKDENLDEKFENTYELFNTSKVKDGAEVCLQFSLNTVREIIEQPIGSPILTYKDKALSNELESVDFNNSVLIKAETTNETIFFIPNLIEEDFDSYLSRCQDLLHPILENVHKNADKVVRIVYLSENESINTFKTEILYSENEEDTPIAKLKKIDVRGFDSYQFNFSGQLSDFIDSLCKIAIIGVSKGELEEDINGCVLITNIIDEISNRNWTTKKEIVRTIEHYAKLLIEGDNAVVNSICVQSKEEYKDNLESKVCSASDYDDNYIDWSIDAPFDSSLHLLSKRIGQLYLIELTKEPSERKHISEKLLNILDKIGQKTINTYIEADDKNIATSIKYNDLLNVLSNKDASQILDNIDMQSGIVQRIKSLCNLLRKDDNIDTLEESLNFLNMDFEGHWIQSYGQKLSSWGTEKTNSFITFLYYLNEIELIDVAKIRDEQIESLTELANSILKIRYDIRENATQLKALIYPQRSRTDNKLYFDSYLKELDEVSSLISKLKQLLDEDSNKISILMFAESLIMHLGNIIRTASNFSYQIKSILSDLKDAKQHIFESYQQEIDRINSKILAKKLIELENNDSGKRHQNYENDALWKIFIDRVRDDEDLKKCIEKNYHPTHLMTINEKELLNISNMIISKKTSLHVRFTEILTSCKDKENKADEINNLIEWTKKLIGIDEDE